MSLLNKIFGKEDLKEEKISSVENKKIETKVMSGFMELVPAQQRAFDKIVEVIRSNYQKFGFIVIDTPVLERAEVLMSKAGGETEKQIYKFKKGERDLAMRFDMTVPLARYVVQHQRDLVFPFKRSAIGKVYRGERPQAGRFREFYQCDIDVIGNENLDISYDAEIPVVIYNIFKQLSFGKFTIRINNRKVLNGFFAELGLSKKSAQVMQTIDRLEKIGFSKVEIELEKLALEGDQISRIKEFLEIKGLQSEVLKALKDLKIENLEFKTGLEELEKVTELMIKLGVSERFFEIDLSIARGLDYYTGTIYETRLDEYPEIGSVCSGGRYDNLVSKFSDKEFPGVGISIGLTRLFDQLYKKGVIQTEEASPTKVIILPMTNNQEKVLELANKLRDENIATEISFDTEVKMKKRLHYADRLGIKYAVFVGENEIAKNFYTLKNLKTGEQEELKEDELLEKLV